MHQSAFNRLSRQIVSNFDIASNYRISRSRICSYKNFHTLRLSADLVTQMVKEGMMQNSVQPLQNNGDSEEEDWDNPVHFNSNEAEYADINAKLDQLNSVLDCLEKKNQSIQVGLMELLQSNREARKQFQESLKT